MNEVKDVKSGEDAYTYPKVVIASETNYGSISGMDSNAVSSVTDADDNSDDFNYITISNDGHEADYHKGGLIIGVLVIFLLGVLAGAIVF
jgi:hypothetical protein